MPKDKKEITAGDVLEVLQSSIQMSAERFDKMNERFDRILNPSNFSWGDPAMERSAEKSSNLTRADGYRCRKSLLGLIQ